MFVLLFWRFPKKLPFPVVLPSVPDTKIGMGVRGVRGDEVFVPDFDKGVYIVHG